MKENFTWKNGFSCQTLYISMPFCIDSLFTPKTFQNNTRTLIKEQYAVGGPFDKWLKTVKTCVTRLSCCQSEGYGNIIQRDFPTRHFTSSVVNKNFKHPTGDQLTCELAAAKTQKEVEAGNDNLRTKNFND